MILKCQILDARIINAGDIWYSYVILLIYLNYNINKYTSKNIDESIMSHNNVSEFNFVNFK